MIRVRPNRCGYTGYTCSGVGNLSSAFSGTHVVCDASAASRTSDWTMPDNTGNYIDNYNNLPVDVQGFIMATAHLLDMDRIQLSCNPPSFSCVLPPEISCGNFGYDPSIDAVVGLWMRIYTDIADYAAIAPRSGATPSWSYIPTGTTGSALCFQTTAGSTVSDLQLVPGILEPMLATDFRPVGVSVNNSTDIALDGIVTALVQLTKWKTEMDLVTADQMNITQNITINQDIINELTDELQQLQLDMQNIEDNQQTGIIDEYISNLTEQIQLNTDNLSDIQQRENQTQLDVAQAQQDIDQTKSEVLNMVEQNRLNLADLQNQLDQIQLGLSTAQAAISNISYGNMDTSRSLANLIRSMNKGLPKCTNFQIELKSGNPLVWNSNHNYPVYRVKGGTAYVNGVGLTVQELAEVYDRDGFYIYLNIVVTSPDATTGKYSTITATLSKNPIYANSGTVGVSIGIGGVHKIEGEHESGVRTYVLYEIVQERCDVDIDLIRISKDNGILYKHKGSDDATLYEGLDTAECPT